MPSRCRASAQARAGRPGLPGGVAPARCAITAIFVPVHSGREIGKILSHSANKFFHCLRGEPLKTAVAKTREPGPQKTVQQRGKKHGLIWTA
jgi:hypothetical protein